MPRARRPIQRLGDERKKNRSHTHTRLPAPRTLARVRARANVRDGAFPNVRGAGACRTRARARKLANARWRAAAPAAVVGCQAGRVGREGREGREGGVSVRTHEMWSETVL